MGKCGGSVLGWNREGREGEREGERVCEKEREGGKDGMERVMEGDCLHRNGWRGAYKSRSDITQLCTEKEFAGRQRISDQSAYE